MEKKPDLSCLNRVSLYEHEIYRAPGRCADGVGDGFEDEHQSGRRHWRGAFVPQRLAARKGTQSRLGDWLVAFGLLAAFTAAAASLMILILA